MRIYAFANGSLAQVRPDNVLDIVFGNPPVGSTLGLDFDDTTNASAISTIISNWGACTVISGVLRNSGVIVTINPDSDQVAATKAMNTGYPALPDWARTGTAAQAETYINGQIFNGQTIAQVNAYIDATITNITTANVAQINARLDAIRTVLKVAATAIINMRGLFVLTAKLLIYIRDLTIRFR